MTIWRLYLLGRALLWLLWLGLLAVAHWTICEQPVPPSWPRWLLERASYAHARCRELQEESILA